MEIAYELILELVFLLFVDSVVVIRFGLKVHVAYLSVLSIYFSVLLPVDQINMKSVYACCFRRTVRSTNYLRHLIDCCQKTQLHDEPEFVYGASNETRGSIKCVS